MKNNKATLYKKLEFIAIESEKSINYLYWKTGMLRFENAQLKDVAKTLTDYFSIPVQIENSEMQNQSFSATFTNPEIDDILDKIQSTINCQITGDGSKLIIH
jgi:ferric-dicitrate binding protein FerR (iron transport regulator)